MRNVLSCLALLAVLCLVATGCEGDGATTQGDAVSPGTLALCGACGQFQGADSCCAEGAETCGGCGLAKGSPGCCKMAKGDDVSLCTACGSVAGSEGCCDEDADRCGCGMIKGSAGCCKMPG